jgi:hypothetical protein
VAREAGEVKLRAREGERVEAREWRVAVLVLVASVAAKGAEEVLNGCGAGVLSSSPGCWL